MSQTVKTIDLGFRPREWQIESYKREAKYRFNVNVVHRRAGKTLKEVLKLIDAALRCIKPLGVFGYIAPQKNQAERNVWRYFLHYLQDIPGIKVNSQSLHITLPNQARIMLLGADDPDSIRGAYFDGVVLDEVAQMRPEVWETIVYPMLLDRRGWADFIGTPMGINLFSELYYRALSADYTDWGCSLYTVYDTGVIPPDEIEKIRKEMSDSRFRQEFMCDFEASSDNVIITLDTARKAMLREAQADIYDPLIMGIDIARFGDDRTVVAIRKGRDARTHAWEHWQGCDTMSTANKIATLYNKYHPDAIFLDGSSAGGGVVDRLRQMRYPVIEVNFGSAADGSGLLTRGVHYVNKRAEMYGEMAEWLRTGAIPDNTELLKELTSVHYSIVTHKGHEAIQLESKKDIKKEIGVSTDMADALALTFASPVNKSIQAGRIGYENPVKTDYDPFARVA